jgi:hypothetical protein
LGLQANLNLNYQCPACCIAYKALSTIISISIATAMSAYDGEIQAVLLNETRLYCVSPPHPEAVRSAVKT